MLPTEIENRRHSLSFFILYPIISTIMLFIVSKGDKRVKPNLFAHFGILVGVCIGRLIWGNAKFESYFQLQTKYCLLFYFSSIALAWLMLHLGSQRVDRKEEFHRNFFAYWTICSSISVVLST